MPSTPQAASSAGGPPTGHGLIGSKSSSTEQRGGSTLLPTGSSGGNNTPSSSGGRNSAYYGGDPTTTATSDGLGPQLASNVFPRASYLADPDLEKVRKALRQSFPHFKDAAQTSLSRDKGWNDKICVASRTRVYLAELEPYYAAVRDAHLLKRSALKELARLAPTVQQDSGESLSSLLIPTNPTRAFLDLLTMCARVHAVLALDSEGVKAVASGYNACHFAANGGEDPDYPEVSAFLLKCTDTSSCLRALSEDLSSVGPDLISDTFCQVLRRLHPVFGAANSWAQQLSHLHNGTSMSSDALLGSEEEDEEVSPTSLLEVAPLALRETARGWVVFGLLVCPNALVITKNFVADTAPGISTHESLLRSILRESLVEPLYRNLTLRLHDVFHELYSWFPPTRPHKERFKEALTDKPKKIVADCAIEATNRACLVHRERRVAVTQTLHALHCRVLEFPGLVGPAAVGLLTALALSREEIYWYLAHLPSHCPPPTIHAQGFMSGLVGVMSGAGQDAAYAKYRAEDWLDPHRVGVLVSVHSSLVNTLKRHWDHVSLYSSELLAVGGIDPVAKSLHSLLANECREFDAALDLFRAGLSKDVIFFHAALEELFASTLENEPRHALGAIDVLSRAWESLDPYCLEERRLMGEHVVSEVDAFLEKIKDRLLGALDDLFTEYSRLDAQVHPMRAAERRFALLRRKKQKEQSFQLGGNSSNNNSNLAGATGALAGVATAAPSTTTTIHPLLESPSAFGDSGLLDGKAGFESKSYLYTDEERAAPPPHALAALKRAKRTVRSLSAALGRKSDQLVKIWDKAYVLHEFLREFLTSWLESRARRCFFAGDGGGVQRPTWVLADLRRAHRVLACACEHALSSQPGWAMDDTHMMRSFVVKEFFSTASVTHEQTMVTEFASHLVHGVVRRLEKDPSFVVYSAHAGGFVSNRAETFLSAAQAPWSLDLREAEAIARLFGARGFRVLDRALMQHLKEKTQQLKLALSEDQAALSRLARALGESSGGAVRLAKACSRAHADAAFQAARAAGVVLTVRAMLRRALAKTWSDATITVVESIARLDPSAVATLTPPDWPEQDFVESLRPAWALAPSDLPLLSAALAASVLGDSWRTSDWVVRLNAHANNAHLVAVSAAWWSRAASGDSTAAFKRCGHDLLAALVGVASEMRASEYKAHPIRGVRMMVEPIVDAWRPHLTWEEAETYLPYAFLTQTVFDRVLGRARGGDDGMTPDDFLRRVLRAVADEDEGAAPAGPPPPGSEMLASSSHHHPVGMGFAAVKGVVQGLTRKF